MSEKSNMQLATERLEAALQGFEASVSNAKDAEKKRDALDKERQVLLEDRSRLADELDATKARVNKLDKARSVSARRVGAAMNSIRVALGNA